MASRDLSPGHLEHVLLHRIYIWCAACDSLMTPQEQAAMRTVQEQGHGGLIWVDRIMLQDVAARGLRG